jgi:hypothetical protein
MTTSIRDFTERQTAEIQPITEFGNAAHRLQERPAKLHLLCGHSGVFTLGLAMGSATQQPIAVIDGALRFNSYTLSKIARSFGMEAKSLLHRTHVTRSFTAYQTEAAITVKLPRFLATSTCRIVVILGLLDTYYDEQVQPHECRQSLRRILSTLRSLVNRNVHVLIADLEVTTPPQGKEDLFRLVKETADAVTILEPYENGFRLKEERSSLLWDATTIRSRLSSTNSGKRGASSAGR